MLKGNEAYRIKGLKSLLLLMISTMSLQSLAAVRAMASQYAARASNCPVVTLGDAPAGSVADVAAGGGVAAREAAVGADPVINSWPPTDRPT